MYNYLKVYDFDWTMSWSHFFSAKCFFVELTNNAPVVIGATINFKAELFDNYGQKTNTDSSYTFRWRDNALPPNTGKVTC